MHSWHWISAAICLAALLLFCITGITLNHPGIGASPAVNTGKAQLPGALLGDLAAERTPQGLSPALSEWIEDRLDAPLRDATIEESPEEIYVSVPGPGRDAWISIDRVTGNAEFELTDRGWVAYFNDLHKGRNTGLVWKIFIDVVAAACVFFSLTGLVLLWIQARQRTSTWPLVSLGVGVLAALMIVFAH